MEHVPYRNDATSGVIQEFEPSIPHPFDQPIDPLTGGVSGSFPASRSVQTSSQSKAATTGELSVFLIQPQPNPVDSSHFLTEHHHDEAENKCPKMSKLID